MAGSAEKWIAGFQGYQLLKMSETDSKWIKERMSSTIVEHGDRKISQYIFHEVLLVKNSDIWNNYIRRLNEIGGEEYLFHGTSGSEAGLVAQRGFKVGMSNPDGMFGKGLYFAEQSSKSSQFTLEEGGLCQQHRVKTCEHCIRTMLLCRVALGQAYRPSDTMNHYTGPPAGYHSVVGEPGNFGGKLRYREYVVYNNHQAYPMYMIKYTIKN